MLQGSQREADSNPTHFIASFESKFEPPQGAVAFHQAIWSAVHETIHSEGQPAAIAHVAGVSRVFREACMQAGPDISAFVSYFEANSDPLFTGCFGDGATSKMAARFYNGIGEAATVMLDADGHEAALAYVTRACEVFETACELAEGDEEAFAKEFKTRF